MTGEIVTDDPELPIQGTTQVPLPVERIWDAFADVPAWRNWNPCIAWARVSGGELKEGATLYWAFKPIRRQYLYRMPAVAKIVECHPQRKVTWEASAPGFHARHSYLFEPLGSDSSRFGSWEVAEGQAYRLMRRFWLAHFRFVCDQSLAGARALGER
jgi:Polyketide cyclase / dehydrase and lipid transport